ncbi:MAG TPA: hypothetical protein VKT52_09600 [Ktedonobacterales bacterium]|nr:hypothetical protein [Ktedonobacterales bacterium]
MRSEIDTRDMRDIQNTSSAPGGEWEAYTGMSMARGSLTPPRLQALDPDATRVLPLHTIADLRLPANLVQRRATEYASYARACGAQHSMRLWRIGYEQAILALAREAAHLDRTATCDALFWEERDGEFWVSATFTQSKRRTVH